MVMESILQTVARFEKRAGGTGPAAQVRGTDVTFSEIRGVAKRLSESAGIPKAATDSMKSRLEKELGISPSAKVVEETVRILAVNETDATAASQQPLNRIMEAYKKAAGARI
jgi:hypothetical protein